MGTRETQTRERIIAQAQALGGLKQGFDNGTPVEEERYADPNRVAALAYQEPTRASNSALSKDPRSQVSAIKRETAVQHIEPAVEHKKAAVRERLSCRLEDAAHRMVDAIPVKTETASLRDVGATLGIVIDKMRLLREEPTTIAEVSPGPREMLELLIKRTMEKFPGTPREEVIEAIRDVRPEAIKFLS